MTQGRWLRLTENTCDWRLTSRRYDVEVDRIYQRLAVDELVLKLDAAFTGNSPTAIKRIILRNVAVAA